MFEKNYDAALLKAFEKMLGSILRMGNRNNLDMYFLKGENRNLARYLAPLDLNAEFHSKLFLLSRYTDIIRIGKKPKNMKETKRASGDYDRLGPATAKIMEAREREVKPEPQDSRMPGSLLGLDKNQMEGLLADIKYCKGVVVKWEAEKKKWPIGK